MAPNMLTGTFVEPSIESSCYELDLRNPRQLDDFNGMSGSPVFCHVSAMRPSQPVLAGMLLRGTASSGRAHFLEFERILAALQSAVRGYLL